MKIAITGAQFSNVGAQSLLFSLINEIYIQYPNATIYYVPLDSLKKYKYSDYNFNFVFDDLSLKDFRDERIKRKLKSILNCAENTFTIMRKREKNVYKYSKIIKDIDALIDVSGYAIASKFTNATNYTVLRHINDAKRNGAKVILMPQSFGPFDYKFNAKRMDELVANSLGKADIIFAREDDGFYLLQDKYNLKNVALSADSVLQASPIIQSNIFVGNKKEIIPIISTNSNVGIVPNQQLIRFGNEQKILSLYKEVIDYLVEKGKNVYIFRHSCDLELCKKIYGLFSDNSKIYLIEDAMDCFAYSRFVCNFDFIIASRYHAIIHAYKQGVPAIILGWAEKYKSLAQLASQDRYVFDVSDEIVDSDNILMKIDVMCDSYIDESKMILSNIKDLKTDSCYQKSWKVLNENSGVN